MRKWQKKLSVNCKDDNIIAVANALLDQVGEEQRPDETARDVVLRLCGDPRVKNVEVTGNYVAMMISDSHTRVLNIVRL